VAKFNGKTSATIVVAVLTIMSGVLLKEWYQVQQHETKIAVVETDIRYIRQSQDRMEKMLYDLGRKMGE
jgi:hypothetical protein